MTTVGDLRAYRAVPAGDGPWPGLVLVHEIFGLDDEMRRHADRLAAMGFVVLAPDLLARGRRLVCLAQTMTALRTRRGQAFDDLELVRAALLADPVVQRLRGRDRVLPRWGVRPGARRAAGLGCRGRQLRRAAHRPRGPRRSLPGRRELRRARPLPARRGVDPRGGADRAGGRARRRRSTPAPGTPSSTGSTPRPGTSHR